jgi:hypothetical protein
MSDAVPHRSLVHAKCPPDRLQAHSEPPHPARLPLDPLVRERLAREDWK